MKSSRILLVVVALQCLILLGQGSNSAVVQPAHAQIPDAGAQRLQIVDELKTLNNKMDRLSELLESGKVQVKLASPDDKGK